jgi:hypothetical protein
MLDRMQYSAYLEGLGSSPPESDVVEIPLLLPGWQMDVLEKAAHERGLTAAGMVRQLLRSFILEKQKERGIRCESAGYAESVW